MLRLSASILLAACALFNAHATANTPNSRSQLGGDTTTANRGRTAYQQASANMPLVQKLDFEVGDSFFSNAWVSAPASTTARDGLGPLFNSNTCSNCHINNGRGRPLQDQSTGHSVAALVKVSTLNSRGQPTAVPGYGRQLQTSAVAPYPAEAKLALSFQTRWFDLPGQAPVALHKPHLDISHLGYGALPTNLQTSLRNAPALIGLGLLEAIPDQALLEYQKIQLERGKTSGRLQIHLDPTTQKPVIGRFGWRADHANLASQVAAAFAEDMGLTSRLRPNPPCDSQQAACVSSVNGGAPEVSDAVFTYVEMYTANLAVPAQRISAPATTEWGEQLFKQVGCADCHKPHWRTGDSHWPWLANQDIYPYTDLMLHDMGAELADPNKADPLLGREWRTPPLWGIGLAAKVAGQGFFLHDGRARSITEAILWHGGESQASRAEFTQLSPINRAALLTFLNSL